MITAGNYELSLWGPDERMARCWWSRCGGAPAGHLNQTPPIQVKGHSHLCTEWLIYLSAIHMLRESAEISAVRYTNLNGILLAPAFRLRMFPSLYNKSGYFRSLSFLNKNVFRIQVWALYKYVNDFILILLTENPALDVKVS